MAEVELSKDEMKLIAFLGDKPSGSDLTAAQEQLSWTEIKVMNSASWLKQKGLVDIKENIINFYSLSKEGRLYAEYGLPERRALTNELCKTSQRLVLSEEENRLALMWLKKKGFADIGKDNKTGSVKIIPTEKGKKFYEDNLHTSDEIVLQLLKEEMEIPEDKLNPEGLEMLKTRKGILKQKETTKRTIILTDKGISKSLDISKNIKIIDEDEISQLTPEHLQSGAWRKIKIRKYHVESFAPTLNGNRKHPIYELMGQVRDIFVEMGFTEVEYDYVQPCFWNMDVLFIPQDHPARDIQDTFYLKHPDRFEISDRDLIEKIKQVHENGGKSGSEGWNYKWDLREAERTVLRTHTTVNTIRYLKNNPNPPVKVFSIGRIFRNEATDATHLSELHQIEGIVMEEQASLSMLIGTLKEFYHRMGFSEVDVIPSYYPYTEPSLDVYVKWKGHILELGGAGIFRPEVTEAFGIKHNVLAWGLGLERLAMIKWDIADIRQVVANDLELLQKRKIIR